MMVTLGALIEKTQTTDPEAWTEGTEEALWDPNVGTEGSKESLRYPDFTFNYRMNFIEWSLKISNPFLVLYFEFDTILI